MIGNQITRSEPTPPLFPKRVRDENQHWDHPEAVGTLEEFYPGLILRPVKKVFRVPPKVITFATRPWAPNPETG